eukprot:SAG11_NODE_5519_length_1537_cov_1.500000_1_plen_189_part_10
MGQHETCLDGGGAHCALLGLLCADGSGCIANRDCNSGLCESVEDESLCASCFNGALDGAESDADCGGTTCQPCADGQACNFGSDCVSLICHEHVCISHSNGIQDGDETCPDGGGSSIHRCHGGAGCHVDDDCRSGHCENEACGHLPPEISCYNEQQDGFETDLDCGGVMCRSIDAGCAVGQHCIEHDDC